MVSDRRGASATHSMPPSRGGKSLRERFDGGFGGRIPQVKAM